MVSLGFTEGLDDLIASIRKSCLINGDDILFRGPHSLYDCFIIASGEAGFKISTGKNYVSMSVCLINSQFFLLTKGRVARVGYLNQNLFEGSLKSLQSKPSLFHLGREVSAFSPQGIALPINTVLQYYPSCRVAIPRFVQRLKQLFPLRLKFEPNWFLPVELGGLGIDPMFGKKVRGPFPGSCDRVEVTQEQRLTAARCACDPDFSIFCRRRACLPRSLDQMDEKFMKSRGYKPGDTKNPSKEELLAAFVLWEKMSDDNESIRRAHLEEIMSSVRPLMDVETRIGEDDHYVLQENEDWSGKDEWLGKALQLANWSVFDNGRAQYSLIEPRIEKFFRLREFSPDYRLSPMSYRKIEWWRRSRVLFSVRSTCPRNKTIAVPRPRSLTELMAEDDRKTSWGEETLDIMHAFKAAWCS